MKKMQGLSWKDYEARCASALLSGARLASVEECVRSTFHGDAVSTRTDIVHNVSTLTGVDRREVERNISSLLSRMEKQGVVKHSGHNEWRLVRGG